MPKSASRSASTSYSEVKFISESSEYPSLDSKSISEDDIFNFYETSLRSDQLVTRGIESFQ